MTAVYKAINAVAADLAKDGIEKGRKNEQQGYKFRGIDDVFNALGSLLPKHGLCVLPRVVSREAVERRNSKGNPLFYTFLQVEFDFVAAEDGSKHTVTTIGEAMDSADKSSNKAMSAAYKYAVMQAFAIPLEGEKDADETTAKVSGWPDGPTNTKTAAMTAFKQVKHDGEACTDLDTFELLLDDNQGLIAQFRLANHPWWFGGYGDERYESIPDWIQRRRADLGLRERQESEFGKDPIDPLETEFPGSTESFKMMIADMRRADDVEVWGEANKTLVSTLTEPELKAFRAAFRRCKQNTKEAA